MSEARLTFGEDDAPVDRTPMAYAARAACGHVRAVIVDDGSAAAARDAGELAATWPGPITLERIPLSQARQETASCARCDVRQHGLGL